MDAHAEDADRPFAAPAEGARLRAVAYRLLGSPGEAEEALGETRARLARAGGARRPEEILARVCLGLLRSRATRREEFWDEAGEEPEEPGEGAGDGSLGQALLVVLETLAPAERLAFVLHDMFAVPYEEIAPVLDRGPDAARRLARRARLRVRGTAAEPETDPARGRAVVAEFLDASRDGDLAALLDLLDPDVVLRIDAAAALSGASPARGAEAVADAFSGRAAEAVPALVNGAPGLVWAPGGRLRVAFGITVTDGRVTAVDLVADPDHLQALDIGPWAAPRPGRR
ncbi:sigma factor-like helix-turn-helix DNA-binding protein [Streptomyces sp. DSM 44917]|uniref:Sigma factor-like helix-turn-helix DNA-binding protein n=1 Tax=Streptomyces boetiae TaxID=3075541 RepID=A0ABU2LAA4_9ACTN|nr:sigma factor-like helix-turn-helix DNA-binding protein [Streptomyces sp. DSM 44917]MDT0308427.1 sigma factor-like helix-turn-helix DNA-binding protein [Streptomyces sp. DSM 44917]